MELSDHEVEQLRKLEQQLAADDPGFAETLTDARKKPRRRLVLGILVSVFGVAVTVGALAIGGEWVVPVGVAGFIVTLAGALLAVGKPTGPFDSTESGRDRGRFMARMEQRWDDRKNGRPQ